MKALVPLLLALMAVSGCSSIRPQITSDATDFNVAVANTNNAVTLKNIARSYLRHPRHYTAVSDIRGNFTVQGSAGISGLFGIGKGSTASAIDAATSTVTSSSTGLTEVVTSTLTGSTGLIASPETLSPSLGLTYTTNPQYTVAILESQDFTNGILKPISGETLGLLASQGWKSEILANLLIESMTFELKETSSNLSASFRITNNARSAGWKTLAKNLEIGVTAKSPGESDLIYLDSVSAAEIAALVEQGLNVRPCTLTDVDANGDRLCKLKKGKVVYRKTAPSSQLTIRRVRSISISAQDYILKGYTGSDGTVARRLLTSYYSNPRCQDNNKSKPLSNGSNNSPNGCPVEFRLLVNNRSTDGVVYYLGEYMRYILDDPKAVPIEIKSTNGQSMPFFAISKTEGPAQLSTSIEGIDFRVPHGPAGGRSMQVIGLVQQLLNLNKASEDLPKANLFQIR